jgi:hypothetical protein
MEVPKDFRDLLALFNENRVEYVIVGAYALGFHGVPRYTGDMDVLVRPDASNAKTIMAALDQFGFGSVGLRPEDFESPDKIVQLGLPPVRIDIITSITGVSWEDAWAGRVEGRFGDVLTQYIGRNELILNKKALGRKKDLADLEALGED